MRTKKDRVVLSIGLLLLFSITAFGLVVARTATRPLGVTLKSHIQICKKNGDKWVVIDEVGPASMTFKASLLEMAKGGQMSTGFTWNTKTKKGKPYSVKLLGGARTKFGALNGKFEAELTYQITYDGKSARVPASLSTESGTSPMGKPMAGKRASGILGKSKTSFTLVSTNKFQPAGGKEHLLLVCREEYSMAPVQNRDK